MDLQERINNYNKTFPNYPPSLFLSHNQIIGLWVMGQNYKTKSSLYGAYPHGYLDRIYSLFPKTDKTLHLFSGSIEDDCDCVDLHNGIDAETMGDKRNNVFKECYKILKKDGILIWLDQVLPNYKKIEFDIIARIGMVKSTNHRFRVITIFKKK